MKKRFLSIILTLTIVLSLLPFGTFSITANAETVFTEGDFECTVLDGIAGITDYFGTADSVEIPSTLGGYTITVIGAWAFKNCTTLANITIPQGITDIGEDAFYNTAYYNNPDNWEDGILYIGEYLIAAKHTNTSCNIKEGTKVIANTAFRNSANIRGVVIPNSITKIPGYAFYDCINLRYVKIPDSVKYIDRLAFCNCSSLTSVTIPESVEYMEYGVFDGCDSLTVLNYNAIDCKPIGEGEEYGIFAKCTSIKQINFGNKVKNIPEYAFLRCTSLENLTIPNSVTNIGEYAFYDCTALKNIYFTGTKTAWNNLTVGIQNTPLSNAKVYFNKSMPIPIASAKVSGIKTKTYSGKTIKQSIKVKLGGKTLKPGTDYTVSYKNNKNIGTATLTIKGKGKYSGTLQKTFTIKPKTTKIKTFKSPKKKQAKVSWSKDSKVSGYQIVYARNSKFTKGKNRVTVKGYKTTSKTIKKLKSKKTYYVKVRSYKTVKGKKIYSSYSKVKKIKIK